MGMGAYDESEQNRREESKDVDDDAEAVTTTKYEGEVSYDTPDSVDVLMDNFQE